MLLTLPDFLGRFHPVLVHLPIGILVLACFFQWLTLKSRFANLQVAIPVMMFWGMIGAVLSCITGYCLSLSGEYDMTIVDRHQWMGIFTAILSLIMYVLYRFYIDERIVRWISLVLLVLITITGHLGGSLTHGSGYLTEGLSNGKTASGPAIPPVANVQEAIVYKDLVQPLLESRCYGCHGPEKQKGKLRLDQPDLILKGGESGKTVVSGKPDESELIARLLLPATDDDHMPPREKPQLTQSEIALLHWWVNSGIDFNKKVKDIAQDEKIKPALLALQTGAGPAENKLTDVPEKEVAPGDERVIEKLRRSGVIILPVARNSNYLSASFFTATGNIDSLVKLLADLNKQLVWLRLDNAAVSDEGMADVAKLTNLTRLQMSNTGITDKGVVQINKLVNLQSLNLVNTKVTSAGLTALKKLGNLRHLYLYKTTVSSADFARLKQQFPSATIDTGKYVVPTLVTDTTVITY